MEHILHVRIPFLYSKYSCKYILYASENVVHLGLFSMESDSLVSTDWVETILLSTIFRQFPLFGAKCWIVPTDH
jgi:hypothetical protein